LVRLADAVFEKNGKSIPYRKVSLTRAGLSAEAAQSLDFVMKEAAAPPAGRRKRKSKERKKAAKAARSRKTGKPAADQQPAAESASDSQLAASNPKLEDALRKWRVAEAKRLGVPAFRILTDRALRAIATTRPVTAAELLAIPGIGIATVEKYGHQLYRILNNNP
jgi:superfamily II DNA helicase RecQ